MMVHSVLLVNRVMTSRSLPLHAKLILLSTKCGLQDSNDVLCWQLVLLIWMHWVQTDGIIGPGNGLVSLPVPANTYTLTGGPVNYMH